MSIGKNIELIIIRVVFLLGGDGWYYGPHCETVKRCRVFCACGHKKIAPTQGAEVPHPVCKLLGRTGDSYVSDSARHLFVRQQHFC